MLLLSESRMALKFCPNLSFMFQEGATLLDRYELAREAGFRGVECAFPYDHTPEEVAEAKNKAGLQQVLINAYPGEWNEGYRGLAAIPGKQEEFHSGIKKSVEYALRLDCKMIHIMAGVVEEETEEHMKLYMDNLNTAADILGESDLTAVIEPINKYSMPNYFLNSYDKAISVIKGINKPNLKLQLDVFHMQQICGNLTKNIEQLLPYVGALGSTSRPWKDALAWSEEMCVGENGDCGIWGNRSVEPITCIRQERTVNPPLQFQCHVQIGQVPNRNGPFTPGEINYDYIFHLLRKNRYGGWIGLEYNPIMKTKDALKWVYDI